MKRRLFLHLGLPKTGTTSIQSFLRQNPEVLTDVGVIYPKVGPENPDHPFFHPKPATAFLAEEVSHQFLARELVGRNRLAAGTPLWSTAFRMIDGSGAHTAVISYENFSSQVSLYEFDAISEQLKAYDVTGLIYLRRQDKWAISLYSHFVRGARIALPFGQFVDDIRARLTYSTLLDEIREQIPLDRLIVRNFDDVSKTGLLQDFFRSLDLPDPPPAEALAHDARNRSLPPWVVLFLLRCIQASFPTERLRSIRKACLRSAAGRRFRPLRPGLDLASPAEREDLRAIMNADAERLAEKYGVRFAEPEAPTAPYRPFDQDDIAAIREMIGPRLAAGARAALDDL